MRNISKHNGLIKRYFFVLTILSVFFQLSTFNARADKIKKTIVIDPGHGGIDTGIISDSGPNEKRITLKLAKLIAENLKENYTVLLTRSDDYALSPEDRAAFANHNKADIFISIHANGNYVHSKHGMIISYFDPIFKTRDNEREAFEDTENGIKKCWEDVQNKYSQKSEALAKILSHRLSLIDDLTVSTQKAPIYIIAGANMPAVLIEIAHLTNPTDVIKLNNLDHLRSLTNQISSAIEDFFK